MNKTPAEGALSDMFPFDARNEDIALWYRGHYDTIRTILSQHDDRGKLLDDMELALNLAPEPVVNASYEYVLEWQAWYDGVQKLLAEKAQHTATGDE